MRKYYLFMIKEEFLSLYKDHSLTLYQVLRQIYYLPKNQINYGYKLYSQIIQRIDKINLDKKLYLDLHQKAIYSKTSTEHVINNLYKDEVSILQVKNSHLVLETNQNLSEFFKLFDSYHLNYFVCDFENIDYFWLSDIKLLV